MEFGGGGGGIWVSLWATADSTVSSLRLLLKSEC